MGSRFSKQKDVTKPPKLKKRQKTKKGMNNPHMAGSTQSLNTDYYAVSFSPNQDAAAAYSQPENAQTLPRHHSVENLSGQPPIVSQTTIKHNQEHHVQTHAQSRNSEDLPDLQSIPSLPPQRKQTSAPKNKLPNRGKDDTEDEGHHLEAGKEGRHTQHVYDVPVPNLRDSGPKFRADRDYESKDEDDIGFGKGDILQVLTHGEVNGRYFVKNLTTGDEGYVQKDFVSILTSHDVESQECFFVELDRDEAVEKLLEPNVELGTYLLRPGADGYALSLRCQNEFYELEIRHYKLRVALEGVCYLETDSNRKTFINTTELIKYYSKKPGLRCMLKKPLPHDAPLNDLTVNISDLILGEKLGSGNFATVYAGTLRNNKEVAVKSLRDGGSMTVEEFRNEAKTMHKLRHKNLVSFLGICEDRGKIHIITERMSQGALHDLLRKDSGSTIKFKDLMYMAIQVTEGMCYLERKGFVHRDLRAANVLVGDENITKIADFGMARLLDNYYEHEDFFQDKKGSVLPYKWTAPEAIRQQKFTVKSDVWSFGILLYEMVTYGEPYAAMSNREVLKWVEEGNRLEKPTNKHCPATLYILMKQCWMINSIERPNFADIKDTLSEINTLVPSVPKNETLHQTFTLN